MIGLMVFQKQLLKLGFVLEDAFGKDISMDGIAFSNITHPLIVALKTFWAA